jgi:hypothetical protein
LGFETYIGISNTFRDGPDNLLQFPECAKLLVQVRRVQNKVLGDVETDFNGTVEVREAGNLFGQVPYSTPLNGQNGIAVQIAKGEGILDLHWVATKNDVTKTSNLVARFAGGRVWLPNAGKPDRMPAGVWNDEIGLGGGTNLTGPVTLGANNDVPDWLDVLMLTTRGIIGKSDTDARKIVGEFSNFTKSTASYGAMLFKIEKGVVSFEVNPEANVLRPCINFQPLLEGTQFSRTKTPYGNAYSHELRHAYIHRMAAQPGNDADGDGLPTTLPNYPNQTNVAHPKRVSFTFNGVANCDVLDLKPTVADKDVNLQATNEPFNLVQEWMPVPNAQLPEYSRVYALADLQKTPVLAGNNIEHAFKLTLINGTVFEFKTIGRNNGQINVPSTAAKIWWEELEPNKGQIKLVIRLNPNDIPRTNNILAMFNGAVMVGIFSYTAKGDKRSRLEWDAHTFAKNEVPENK